MSNQINALIYKLEINADENLSTETNKQCSYSWAGEKWKVKQALRSKFVRKNKF